MSNTTVFLSDIIAVAKLITRKTLKVMINDPRKVLLADVSPAEHMILIDTESNFITTRFNEDIFLLYVNLSYRKVTDKGYDAIIDFFSPATYSSLNATKLNYLTNEDNSLRCVAPENEAANWFLSFSKAGVLREVAYKTASNFLFGFRKFNLSNTNRITIHTFRTLHIEKWIREEKSYSVETLLPAVSNVRKATSKVTDGVKALFALPAVKSAERMLVKEFATANYR